MKWKNAMKQHSFKSIDFINAGPEINKITLQSQFSQNGIY